MKKLKTILLTVGIISICTLKINANEHINIDYYKINNSDIIENIFIEKNIYIKELNKFNISYKPITISLYDYVKSQEGKLNIVSKNNKFVNATIDEVASYVKPNANLPKEDMYQYLILNKYRNINELELNKYLNNIKVKSGNINIFKNKAKVFNNSAKKYNIDPIYLVAHTMLETGNGQSKLAQGHDIILDEDGKALKDDKGYVMLKDKDTDINSNTMRVYNFFGIGAVDSAVIQGGTTTAYNNGWTSIDKTIEGSAKWISENYINSKKYNHQYTLYSMKWDYVNKWHQYATDIGWPTKISRLISKLSYIYNYPDLELEIPKYNDIYGWIKQFDNNYVYIDKDTNMPHKGWLKLDKIWYYLGEDCIRKTGWQGINGNWYYFNKNGIMQSNKWIEIDNEWYYLNPNGSMKTGWLKSYDGKWYYLKPNGVMSIGWEKIDGKKYYFNDNGVMESNKWIKTNNEWYYLNPNGSMKTGWLKSYDGKWYYLKTNGAMSIGWQSIDGQWYYFNDNGVMESNKWIEINNEWYYLNPNGSMKTGWLKSYDGKWYYLKTNGAMSIGWQSIDGQWYYFNDNGVMESNKWIEINNEWYYLNPNGSMETGWLKSYDGKRYYLKSNGAMAKNTIIDGWYIDNSGVAIKNI